MSTTTETPTDRIIETRCIACACILGESTNYGDADALVAAHVAEVHPPAPVRRTEWRENEWGTFNEYRVD